MAEARWTPLDELRAIVRDRLAAGEQPILGMPKADFDAWEAEMHEGGSGIVEYWEGE